MISFAQFGSKGRNILILPGLAIPKEKYFPLAQMLAKDNRVFLIDLPGTGKVPMHKKFVREDYVSFVQEVLKHHALKDPVLVGNSLGGSIAIALAAQEKMKIKELVLIDSGGMHYKHLKSRGVAFFSALHPERLSELLQAVINVKDPVSGWYFFRQLCNVAISPNIEGLLNNLTAKTLVLWGNEDNTWPLTIGKELSSKISGSKFVVISNAGHRLPIENPTVVARYISDFLKR